jgi:DNA helicase-2/ATP-dependent DNA helicase PcrA
MNNFTPRPSQLEILAYRGGKMGISAVPGSGKTFVLSRLAADIIARGELGPEQEVLVVTLVNSAVDNFSSRISGFIQEHGLLPHIGYRVRTLHGLAHDIVREKPALVGLEERFSIIDEREADFIRKEAAQAWLQSHPNFLDDYLDPGMDDSKRDWVRRQQLPELVNSLALSFIRSAKDRRLAPEDLRRALDRQPAALPLAEMGWEIYANYQRALTYRGAVDFDDLIRLALHLLELDSEFLERLRYRWPVILEDEAQDSSQLQEQILRLLAGDNGRELPYHNGNWVRVGDPNQAIFETFTTANPRYLRDFIAHEADFRRELPDSGRSQPSIIALANYLIDWVNGEHPDSSARDALTVPYIQPTPEGDPQPNPPDDPAGIRLISRKFTPDEEVAAVVDSLEKWLPEHKDWSVAVLVPRNKRGVEVIEALKKRNIDYIEFLASTASTRAAAGALGNVVAYLADPQSATKLARIYQVWRRDWREGENDQRALYKHVPELLRKCREVESFLAPRPDRDWLADLQAMSGSPNNPVAGSPDPATELAEGLESENNGELRSTSRRGRETRAEHSAEMGVSRRAEAGSGETESEEILLELATFRDVVRRWQGTTLLPIDQMILTLAQDLFTEAADLALAHKLALVLRQAAEDHADWRLPELTGELGVIARNERRFIGFSSDDSGFDPEQHKGKVVVTTMHKAKGLEWDRVYLMSVNNYDFPSAQPYDRYISEKRFVRDGLNLEAEALAQLEALGTSNEYEWYAEGAATQQARLDYVRERLRLLYVGITRAKRELIVTWNSGRTGEQTQAIPFAALLGWWEGKSDEH